MGVPEELTRLYQAAASNADDLSDTATYRLAHRFAARRDWNGLANIARRDTLTGETRALLLSLVDADKAAAGRLTEALALRLDLTMDEADQLVDRVDWMNAKTWAGSYPPATVAAVVRQWINEFDVAAEAMRNCATPPGTIASVLNRWPDRTGQLTTAWMNTKPDRIDRHIAGVIPQLDCPGHILTHLLDCPGSVNTGGRIGPMTIAAATEALALDDPRTYQGDDQDTWYQLVNDLARHTDQLDGDAWAAITEAAFANPPDSSTARTCAETIANATGQAGTPTVLTHLLSSTTCSDQDLATRIRACGKANDETTLESVLDELRWRTSKWDDRTGTWHAAWAAAFATGTLGDTDLEQLVSHLQAGQLSRLVTATTDPRAAAQLLAAYAGVRRSGAGAWQASHIDLDKLAAALAEVGDSNASTSEDADTVLNKMADSLDCGPSVTQWLKVGDFFDLAEDTDQAGRLTEHLVSLLGDDDAVWELFEHLADSSSERIGPLIDNCKHIAGATS
jgi:hypothetical protein